MYIDEIMPDSQSVERDDGFKKLIREIKNPGVSEYEVPECVQAKMREYQVVGYRWLKILQDIVWEVFLQTIWDLERLYRP